MSTNKTYLICDKCEYNCNIIFNNPEGDKPSMCPFGGEANWRYVE